MVILFMHAEVNKNVVVVLSSYLLKRSEHCFFFLKIFLNAVFQDSGIQGHQ